MDKTREKFKKLDGDSAVYGYHKMVASLAENRLGAKDMIRLCEGIYYDDKDIYYNKDKFDRGEVNLCFIIGHSGSGKSTMALELLEKDSTLHICEMDKFYYLIWNKINFTKEEQGILFEMFMQYDGKRLSQISPQHRYAQSLSVLD